MLQQSSLPLSGLVHDAGPTALSQSLGAGHDLVMRGLIIFESAFGNTEEVARSVAVGLARHLGVEVVEVSSARYSLVSGADLVVLGGPTHAFGMSNPSTRREAVMEGGTHGSTSTGIREWITDLPPGNRHVAVFDTKVRSTRWLGGAAKDALREMRRRGYQPVADIASFYVTGPAGPLAAGERERAEAWGDQIAELALAGLASDTTRRAENTGGRR